MIITRGFGTNQAIVMRGCGILCYIIKKYLNLLSYISYFINLETQIMQREIISLTSSISTYKEELFSDLIFHEINLDSKFNDKIISFDANCHCNTRIELLSLIELE